MISPDDDQQQVILLWDHLTTTTRRIQYITRQRPTEGNITTILSDNDHQAENYITRQRSTEGNITMISPDDDRQKVVNHPTTITNMWYITRLLSPEGTSPDNYYQTVKYIAWQLSRQVNQHLATIRKEVVCHPATITNRYKSAHQQTAYHLKALNWRQ